MSKQIEVGQVYTLHNGDTIRAVHECESKYRMFNDTVLCIQYQKDAPEIPHWVDWRRKDGKYCLDKTEITHPLDVSWPVSHAPFWCTTHARKHIKETMRKKGGGIASTVMWTLAEAFYSPKREEMVLVIDPDIEGADLVVITATEALEKWEFVLPDGGSRPVGIEV